MLFKPALYDASKKTFFTALNLCPSGVLGKYVAHQSPILRAFLIQKSKPISFLYSLLDSTTLLLYKSLNCWCSKC